MADNIGAFLQEKISHKENAPVGSLSSLGRLGL
jgi:hypothetical protein